MMRLPGLLLGFNSIVATPVRRHPRFTLFSELSKGHRIQHRNITALSTEKNHGDEYKAIVVGAGPAGIATVGNLLDIGLQPILWVDKRFEGGRLNQCYREVPSNTKVALFLSYAESVTPFREIIDSTPTPNPHSTLVAMKQDAGCKLKYAADLCLMLTKGLGGQMGVQKHIGVVESAFQDAAGKWHVTTTKSISNMNERASKRHHAPWPSQATAPLLILATGSSPISPTLPQKFPHLETLDLDLCLSPSQLKARLSPSKPLTVAIVGASHSAILILRALYILASTSYPRLQIYWFSRHALRYAEDKGDWILRDNTGLKGEAAQWARDMVEDDTFDTSGASRHIKKIRTKAGEEEKESYEQFLPACTHLVEAVGYVRDPLPTLERKVRGGADGGKSDEVMIGDIKSDGVTGGFVDAEGAVIEGLKGVGIAFPERVTDREGNVEWAVGLWKFMKFLKRVVPEWVESEQKSKA